MLIGIILLFALKVASQWEKAVVLRLGKFLSLRGPGAFWIVPIIDTVGEFKRVGDNVRIPRFARSRP
jgi:regulator of protease activity HflC (stomatin/prohibitin superfamily)